MKKSYYSHGKLLLTAEYLILDGTKALAIPTKKGQWLTITENSTDHINWKSFDEEGNCWFQTKLSIENNGIQEIEKNNSAITETLIKILNTAKKLNPKFLSKEIGLTIETKLEFNRLWGLGSSSTLINNIAQWAEVNAFDLLNKSFGGSGYDIACAQYSTPITYVKNGNKPIIQELNFDPIFKNKLFFIHLNQKQNSKESIRHYQSLSLKDHETTQIAIEEITFKIAKCTKLAEFKNLIDTHEKIISKIIKTPTVKSVLFPDYTGSIKSLGGWGGDFILATGDTIEIEYFKIKGYTTIIPYSEMVL